MNQYFKADFFCSNRASFKQRVKGLSILGANKLILKSADESFDFIQEPNFWYLTGLDYAGLILVIDDDQEFMILPRTNRAIECFDGALNKNELSIISGISEIYDHSKGIKILKDLVLKNNQVNTLVPLKRRSLEFNSYPNPNKGLLIKQIKHFNKNILINDLTKTFMELRAIKSKSEIEALNKASKITIDAITKVESLINQTKLTTAREVANELEYLFKKAGSLGHAFSPIVANTKDATTIHFKNLEPKLIKNNLIVIDVGAEFKHYKADITRTIPYGNVPTRQKEVLLAVKKIQDDAIKFIKPGLTFKEIHNFVEDLIQKELIKLGLISPKNPKAISLYFPHAFGHSLGLETHDLINYQAPLEENMVITMEPGIYIKEEGIAVRIEDDILITKNGSKILGMEIKY